MTLELIRTAARFAAHGRAIAFGGVVALVCSACASEETVATIPAGAGMTPAMADAEAKHVVSAPVGYSTWSPNSGASMTSAMAKAPTVSR